MLNRLYIGLFFFALSVQAACVSYAQGTGTIAVLTGKLDRQPPVEKAYLHLVKSSYGFGDTVWYKAYVVVGSHHQLSALSGVLYVELISPADTLITRQIIHLTAGVGWGGIPLQQELPQGLYRIRAYTNWMRNGGPGGFYEQKIRLGGIAPQNEVRQSAPTSPDVQFFPEGGNMVAGVRSRVAFKAVGTDGLGVEVTGTIEDNSGNIITAFTTQHLGMGEFAFIPESGKSYMAKISGTGETAFTVNLPPVKEEGYTITLNNSGKDSVYITIAVNHNTLDQLKDSTFYLLAQSNGKVYYAARGKLQYPGFAARVDKKRFPAGIAQFTAFNSAGRPVAERIAYIEGVDTLHFKVTPAQTNDTKKITLQATGENNQPVSGTFSAAVTREGPAGVNERSESTMTNNLLLTSDLKGTVEQPDYYFTAPNDDTRAGLDLVMLTQGYRRLAWEQVWKDSSAAIKYLPGHSLEIAGSIKTAGGKPVSNGRITLLANKANLIRDTIADSNGNFRFINLYLSDTTLVVLKARKENNSDNVKIRVVQPDYPAITKDTADKIINSGQPDPQSVLLYQQYHDQQTDFKTKGIKLKEVKVTASRITAPDLSESASLYKGGADQVIMGEDLSPAGYLSDALLSSARFFHTNRNGVFNTRGNAPMSVIVDGIILGSSHLDDIAPNDVYSIEVLRTSAAKSIYGSSIESGGALVITLKHGGEKTRTGAVYTSGLLSIMVNGFTPFRTFYTPKYAVKLTATVPATVYWKPDILTGKDGQASFEYKENETKGNYRLVIEGIDDNGNLGRQVYRYEVK